MAKSKLVDSFLTHEGENVDEAKNSLKGKVPDTNKAEDSVTDSNNSET